MREKGDLIVQSEAPTKETKELPSGISLSLTRALSLLLLWSKRRHEASRDSSLAFHLPLQIRASPRKARKEAQEKGKSFQFFSFSFFSTSLPLFSSWPRTSSPRRGRK